MKYLKTFIFLHLFIFIFLFTSCEENSSNSATFSGMAVTIQGDEYNGYKFYTDFDAVLIPTNINRYSHLKDVKRAIISFDMNNGVTDINQIKVNETYEISLNPNGVNMEIPTYNLNIDISSQEYKENGNDSINNNNKILNSLDLSQGRFYVQNGYMNIVPTFDYSPTKEVYFALYYNGVEDIDLAGREVTLNLYFNNNTDTPFGSTTSVISLKMCEDIYSRFLYEGVDDKDKISVRLKVRTKSGNEEIKYSTTLGDLMSNSGF